MRRLCPRRNPSTRVYIGHIRWGMIHIKRKDRGKSEGSTNQSCAYGSDLSRLLKTVFPGILEK